MINYIAMIAGIIVLGEDVKSKRLSYKFLFGIMLLNEVLPLMLYMLKEVR